MNNLTNDSCKRIRSEVDDYADGCKAISAKRDENQIIVDGVSYEAFYKHCGCNGCAATPLSELCDKLPSCIAKFRNDAHDIIWVEQCSVKEKAKANLKMVSNFEAGKFYTTRSGLQAIIYEVAQGLAGAARLGELSWLDCHWRLDGSCPLDDRFDLIGEGVAPKPKHPAEDWVVDQKIMCLQRNNGRWYPRHFSHYDKETGKVYTFGGTSSSWSVGGKGVVEELDGVRLPTEEELKGSTNHERK